MLVRKLLEYTCAVPYHLQVLLRGWSVRTKRKAKLAYAEDNSMRFKKVKCQVLRSQQPSAVLQAGGGEA